MELKQKEEREEEILEQVLATKKEGKAKIEKRFKEITKEFLDGVEREKKLMEDKYVSQQTSH